LYGMGVFSRVCQFLSIFVYIYGKNTSYLKVGA
jgi:hypothetical protein